MSQESREKRRGERSQWTFGALLRLLGPGLITGAADDDPSGIATYSQTGAQFGFGQIWTALYQAPLLIAVQECCARIGSVTNKGLAGVIKQHYSRRVLFGAVALVAAANTINIGADLGAVAAAAQLVKPAPFWLYAATAALLVLLLEIWFSYRSYAKLLKWLALALLAYPATALVVREPWGEILRSTLVPHVELSFSYLFLITGVFGTTISPYMFFWQASQEVEEEIDRGFAVDETGKPELPRNFIGEMRIDNAIGMIASELVQWFIIMTTATVLFSHGVTNIATAADAARALEPLVQTFANSGQLAKDLFAVGVIGLGLLAIPVLAGSAAYALAEALDWREGLSRKFGDARGFYGVIVVATLLGLAMNFLGIDPVRALVYTAVLNGIAAAPLLFLIARINGDASVLGDRTGGLLSQATVWLAFAVMALASIGLLCTTIR